MIHMPYELQHIYLAIMLLLSPARLAEFTGAAVAARVRCHPGQVDKGVPGTVGPVAEGGPAERAHGLGIGVATGSSVPVGSPALRANVGEAAAAEPAAVHVI